MQAATPEPRDPDTYERVNVNLVMYYIIEYRSMHSLFTLRFSIPD